jgi:P-type E1-E2 ATPase
VVQEAKAEAALDALKSMTANKATVVRDGVEQHIDGAEVVVGDLVILETGAAVPADLRITDSQELQSREMALTGESEPVGKQTAYESITVFRTTCIFPSFSLLDEDDDIAIMPQFER